VPESLRLPESILPPGGLPLPSPWAGAVRSESATWASAATPEVEVTQKKDRRQRFSPRTTG